MTQKQGLDRREMQLFITSLRAKVSDINIVAGPCPKLQIKVTHPLYRKLIYLYYHFGTHSLPLYSLAHLAFWIGFSYFHFSGCLYFLHAPSKRSSSMHRALHSSSNISHQSLHTDGVAFELGYGDDDDDENTTI